MRVLLLNDIDVSSALAKHLRKLREALAARSTVPAPTIKKFELTGKISLRQLLLLWQCLDDLNRLFALTQPEKCTELKMPTTIEEVLRDGF